MATSISIDWAKEKFKEAFKDYFSEYEIKAAPDGSTCMSGFMNKSFSYNKISDFLITLESNPNLDVQQWTFEKWAGGYSVVIYVDDIKEKKNEKRNDICTRFISQNV